MRQPRVLVIDDSPDIHKLIEVRLRAEDLEVFAAHDAPTGLVMAGTLLPDLILLDIDMPDMSGFEACQRLKSDPLTMDLPIIFLTGATAVFNRVQGFDLGAVDYITKPFEPSEMRARIRAALRTKRYLDLLATRANVDGVTGLWNRTWFDQRIRDEVSAARRFQRELSLVMIDIDHFQSINDAHGHAFGDRALQTLGELLSLCTRTTDVACRYGGEELAVILTETHLAGALGYVARTRAAIAAIGLTRGGRPVPLTVSIGVASGATLGFEKLSVERLVAAANVALHIAKESGRDRACVHGIDQRELRWV